MKKHIFLLENVEIFFFERYEGTQSRQNFMKCMGDQSVAEVLVYFGKLQMQASLSFVYPEFSPYWGQTEWFWMMVDGERVPEPLNNEVKHQMDMGMGRWRYKNIHGHGTPLDSLNFRASYHRKAAMSEKATPQGWTCDVGVSESPFWVDAYHIISPAICSLCCILMLPKKVICWVFEVRQTRQNHRSIFMFMILSILSDFFGNQAPWS